MRLQYYRYLIAKSVIYNSDNYLKYSNFDSLTIYTPN